MTTFLITGASRGIGLGLVERLAARGDRVLACARDPAAPDLAALAGRHSDLITPHRLDVGDPDSVATLAAALDGQPIDVLINNAGIRGPDRQSALDMDFDGFAQALAINTLAPLRVAQALLPNLRRGERPRIVTVSSIMGQLTGGGAGDVAYRTSKAAVNKVMQGLAAELRPAGVTVVVVHPGWVKTDMGGKGAALTVAQSTRGLVALIDALTVEQTGGFYNHDGQPLEW
ncbi:SDR family oxidoreductase [Rhodoplanes sp. TEM]|uniref:SDR family oxidoreductase n=1 Tax=Rhodoplanes tepidamans TaxID=200616 RepID=A0ABT5J796_RHOTP|nr:MULTISPECIES: SDR family oxidoreductase [Rhodoplanes]MDC7785332.1 SDR family oxidoreductase [Rhodoplanes tepidamans]MDC7986271.1 SDR family oxidoreductase [Rhodoplanes sp. TEM]MDQ0353217.1 NAD(P)-dependent dehydrogenase (short-subunit alcohol dehydrogenase family) [Rhodoplanes tepidamans]